MTEVAVRVIAIIVVVGAVFTVGLLLGGRLERQRRVHAGYSELDSALTDAPGGRQSLGSQIHSMLREARSEQEVMRKQIDLLAGHQAVEFYYTPPQPAEVRLRPQPKIQNLQSPGGSP